MGTNKGRGLHIEQTGSAASFLLLLLDGWSLPFPLWNGNDYDDNDYDNDGMDVYQGGDLSMDTFRFSNETYAVTLSLYFARKADSCCSGFLPVCRVSRCGSKQIV